MSYILCSKLKNQCVVGLERWLSSKELSLTALLEDPCSIPSVHMTAHKCPLLISSGTGHAHGAHMSIYAGNTPTHI